MARLYRVQYWHGDVEYCSDADIQEFQHAYREQLHGRDLVRDYLPRT